MSETAPTDDAATSREERTPERWNTRGGWNIHDIFALEALRPLGGSYLPWTGYALHPRSLVRVINEAMLHDAQFIVETGAGISTIFLGRYLRQWGGPDARIVSVEDDGPWLDKVRRYVAHEELDDIIELVAAPLTPWTPTEREYRTPATGWQFEYPENWYEVEPLRRAVGDRKIDLLLVDGPKGRGSISRYPAVHELLDNLDQHTIVILDDIAREAETEIIERWARLARIRCVPMENTTIAVGKRSLPKN